MSQAGITTITSVPTPATFEPNNTFNIFDDFIGVDVQSTNENEAVSSAFTWRTDMNTIGDEDWNVVGLASVGHPGVIGTDALGAAGKCNLFLSMDNFDIATQYVLGGGTATINWVINVANLSDNTNTYVLRVGLGDTSGADQVNGVYFEYTNTVNSGQWQYKTANASTRTTSNSSTAVTTGWHNLGITIDATASSISFEVDGVSLGSAIATNIPTAIVTPFLEITRSAGTIAENTILVDLFYMSQAFTSAR